MENYGTPHLISTWNFVQDLEFWNIMEEMINTGQRPDQVLMLYVHQNTKKNYNFT
jgi:hypothetical protein